jgi:hypothetical protein
MLHVHGPGLLLINAKIEKYFIYPYHLHNSDHVLPTRMDKTNRLRYELDVILVEECGTAFPISYCFLQSCSEVNVPWKRRNALRDWMGQLRDKGLNPRFVFSDKDLAQLSAAQIVRSDCEHYFPLCQLTGSYTNRCGPQRSWNFASGIKRL